MIRWLRKRCGASKGRRRRVAQTSEVCEDKLYHIYEEIPDVVPEGCRKITTSNRRTPSFQRPELSRVTPRETCDQADRCVPSGEACVPYMVVSVTDSRSWVTNSTVGFVTRQSTRSDMYDVNQGDKTAFLRDKTRLCCCDTIPGHPNRLDIPYSEHTDSSRATDGSGKTGVVTLEELPFTVDNGKFTADHNDCTGEEHLENSTTAVCDRVYDNGYTSEDSTDISFRTVCRTKDNSIYTSSKGLNVSFLSISSLWSDDLGSVIDRDNERTEQQVPYSDRTHSEPDNIPQMMSSERPNEKRSLRMYGQIKDIPMSGRTNYFPRNRLLNDLIEMNFQRQMSTLI